LLEAIAPHSARSLNRALIAGIRAAVPAG